MATITVEVTGRANKPLSSKLSPSWWFQNDEDPVPPAWYAKDNPGLDATALANQWWWRNFGHNFNFYILGLADRNFTAWGKATPDPFAEGNPLTIQSDMLNVGQYGTTWSIILPGKEVWIPRPYISFAFKWLAFHIGWKTDGDFALRLIIKPTPESLDPNVRLSFK